MFTCYLLRNDVRASKFVTHNPKVTGSNPVPATINLCLTSYFGVRLFFFSVLLSTIVRPSETTEHVSKTPHRRRYTLGNSLGRLARPNSRTPRDRADLVRIDLPRTTDIRGFVYDHAHMNRSDAFQRLIWHPSLRWAIMTPTERAWVQPGPCRGREDMLQRISICTATRKPLGSPSVLVPSLRQGPVFLLVIPH